MLFGTRLHLLLERFPELPRADWPEQARDLLAGAEGGLPDGAVLARLIEEAAAVIDAPDLAELFAIPDGAEVLAEVELAIDLPGIGALRGVIDRLIVSPERVSVIDYKTNATAPDRPEATPEGILRQMAAYRAAIAAIYPGRAVAVGVLWTSARSLMWLPDPLLDRAMAGLDPAGQAT